MGPSCYIEYRGIGNRTIKGFYCMLITQAKAMFPPELVPASLRPGQVVVHNRRHDGNRQGKPGMEINVPNQI